MLIKDDKIWLVVATFNPDFYVLDFKNKQVIYKAKLDTFNIIQVCVFNNVFGGVEEGPDKGPNFAVLTGGV